MDGARRVAAITLAVVAVAFAGTSGVTREILEAVLRGLEAVNAWR